VAFHETQSKAKPKQNNERPKPNPEPYTTKKCNTHSRAIFWIGSKQMFLGVWDFLRFSRISHSDNLLNKEGANTKLKTIDLKVLALHILGPRDG
jgi:hypothetical protein